MSIDVIQGVPGSGKTYYAVRRLLQAKEKGHYLITNIDGFTQADEFVDAQTGTELAQFILGRDWQEFAKTLQGRKIYLVIDEAQRLYPSNGMEKNSQQDLFYFLEYHRHYGMDITLITQNKSSLHNRVHVLLHEICQVSKVVYMGKTQRVRHHDPATWELIRVANVKREQKIYDAYKSASVESGFQKPSNPMKRIMLLSVLSLGALLIAVGGLIYYLAGYLGYLSNDAIAADQPAPAEVEVKKEASMPPSPQAPKSLPKKPLTSQTQEKLLPPTESTLSLDWVHPRFPKTFNHKKCARLMFSWECKNVPFVAEQVRSGAFSLCKKDTCTVYFDAVPQLAETKKAGNSDMEFKISDFINSAQQQNPFK